MIRAATNSREVIGVFVRDRGSRAPDRHPNVPRDQAGDGSVSEVTEKIGRGERI